LIHELASKARELSVLSDVDGGRGDDAHSESSSSIPAPGKRTPYKFLNSLAFEADKTSLSISFKSA
jgi:hypothetical protein